MDRLEEEWRFVLHSQQSIQESTRAAKQPSSQAAKQKQVICEIGCHGLNVLRLAGVVVPGQAAKVAAACSSPFAASF
jgi:hypothetical protein